jgi:ArsR family transcriptional regulator
MPDVDALTQLCSLIGDPTRIRLLRLLAVEALSVAEITHATRLPQPRVSTHLRRLREAGLVDVQKVGGQSFYARDPAAWAGAGGVLLQSLLDSVDDPVLAEDEARAESLVAARHAEAGWVDALAGRMARNYSPGRTWESLARTLGGLSRPGRLIDIASGDGAVPGLLAPWADEVVCVDNNPRVVEAGQARTAPGSPLRFVLADMHALPFPDLRFDRALLLGALQYTTHPAAALHEAGRVLAPGGRLVVSALRRHPHGETADRYGHLNHGFRPDELSAMIVAAGLQIETCGVASREHRPPHFEVVVATATRP